MSLPFLYDPTLILPGGEAANGVHYPLRSTLMKAGGTRERHLAGTSFEPRKLLEHAAIVTNRGHAMLTYPHHQKHPKAVHGSAVEQENSIETCSA